MRAALNMRCKVSKVNEYAGLKSSDGTIMSGYILVNTTARTVRFILQRNYDAIASSAKVKAGYCCRKRVTVTSLAVQYPGAAYSLL